MVQTDYVGKSGFRAGNLKKVMLGPEQTWSLWRDEEPQKRSKMSVAFLPQQLLTDKEQQCLNFAQY
jgi:hypothetical protein